MLKHFGLYKTEDEVKEAIASKKLEEPWIVYIEGSSRMVYSVNDELDVVIPSEDTEEEIDLDTTGVLKFNIDRIYFENIGPNIGPIQPATL